LAPGENRVILEVPAARVGPGRTVSGRCGAVALDPLAVATSSGGMIRTLEGWQSGSMHRS
jgi:isoaspartyl peptidase/L-asparaginase-like protein (Ntn-hydrolase superfamily)